MMTVRELIAQLEKIEDKDSVVVCDSMNGGIYQHPLDEIIEGFYKSGSGSDWWGFFDCYMGESGVALPTENKDGDVVYDSTRFMNGAAKAVLLYSKCGVCQFCKEREVDVVNIAEESQVCPMCEHKIKNLTIEN